MLLISINPNYPIYMWGVANTNQLVYMRRVAGRVHQQREWVKISRPAGGLTL